MNTRITFRVMGGMGNQLFQLTKAIHVANASNVNIDLQLSDGNMQGELGDRIEKLPLTILHTEIDKITRMGVGLLLHFNWIPKFIFKALANLWNYIQGFFFLIKCSIFKRVEVADNLGFYEVKKLSSNCLIVGYFQTYRYIEGDKVRCIMENLLNPYGDETIEFWRKRAQEERPVVLHVRLGDYLNEKKFGVLSFDYYRVAIEHLFKNHKFRTVWVFSDDLQLCRSRIETPLENLCKPQQISVRWISKQELDDWKTWQIMRLGFAYVIANSTFSWWAAMLRIQHCAPVLAPSQWFKGMREPIDLIPDDWVRIPSKFEVFNSWNPKSSNDE